MQFPKNEHFCPLIINELPSPKFLKGTRLGQRILNWILIQSNPEKRGLKERSTRLRQAFRGDVGGFIIFGVF